jgi:hypothetical protein
LYHLDYFAQDFRCLLFIFANLTTNASSFVATVKLAQHEHAVSCFGHAVAACGGGTLQSVTVARPTTPMHSEEMQHTEITGCCRACLLAQVNETDLITLLSLVVRPYDGS